MLLSFVQEILAENNYDVRTATNAADSLKEAEANPPDLILLDYILPDMKGDEVTRRLRENPVTAKIPVVYMSGLGTDLRPETDGNPNVIGSLNKPFTSDLLIKTVETHMPESPDQPKAPAPETQGVSQGLGDFGAPVPQMSEPEAHSISIGAPARACSSRGRMVERSPEPGNVVTPGDDIISITCIRARSRRPSSNRSSGGFTSARGNGCSWPR